MACRGPWHAEVRQHPHLHHHPAAVHAKGRLLLLLLLQHRTWVGLYAASPAAEPPLPLSCQLPLLHLRRGGCAGRQLLRHAHWSPSAAK